MKLNYPHSDKLRQTREERKHIDSLVLKAGLRCRTHFFRMLTGLGVTQKERLEWHLKKGVRRSK